MNKPTDSLDELIDSMYGKDVVPHAYANRDGKLTKAQAKAQIQAWHQTRLNQTLERLKGQLPEKQPIKSYEHHGTTKSNFYRRGYNKALKDVKVILLEAIEREME